MTHRMHRPHRYRVRLGEATLDYVLTMCLIIGTITAGLGILLVNVQQPLRQLVALNTTEVGPRTSAAAETASNDQSLSRTKALLFAEVVSFSLLGGLLIVWSSRRHAAKRAGQSKTNNETTDLAHYLQPLLFEKRQRILRFFLNRKEDVLEREISVADLASSRVVSVLPTATRGEIEALVRAKQLRHLAVCDREQRLLGVISDRDLLMRRGETARELMTCEPLAIPETTPATVAISTMLARRISCLPIVAAENKLVAIVTTTDFLLTLQCFLRVMAEIATMPPESPPGLTSRKSTAATDTTDTRESSC